MLSQQEEIWKQLERNTISQRVSPVLLKNGKRILFIGGYNDVHGTVIYDIQSNSFPKELKGPHPQNTILYAPAMTIDISSNKVYVWGGGHGQCFAIYDLATKTWDTKVGQKTVQFSNEKYAMYNVGQWPRIICDAEHTLHVIGGQDSNLHTYYDINQQSFKVLHQFDEYIYGFGLVHDLQNNRFILFGGHDGSEHYLDSIWLFDLSTKVWTECDFKLKINLGFSGFVFLDGIQTLLVFGGQTCGSKDTDIILKLDFINSKCTELEQKCPILSTFHALLVPNLVNSDEKSSLEHKSNSSNIHLFDDNGKDQWCTSLECILNSSSVFLTPSEMKEELEENEKELSRIKQKLNALQVKNGKQLNRINVDFYAQIIAIEDESLSASAKKDLMIEIAFDAIQKLANRLEVKDAEFLKNLSLEKINKKTLKERKEKLNKKWKKIMAEITEVKKLHEESVDQLFKIQQKGTQSRKKTALEMKYLKSLQNQMKENQESIATDEHLLHIIQETLNSKLIEKKNVFNIEQKYEKVVNRKFMILQKIRIEENIKELKQAEIQAKNDRKKRVQRMRALENEIQSLTNDPSDFFKNKEREYRNIIKGKEKKLKENTMKLNQIKKQEIVIAITSAIESLGKKFPKLAFLISFYGILNIALTLLYGKSKVCTANETLVRWLVFCVWLAFAAILGVYHDYSLSVVRNGWKIVKNTLSHIFVLALLMLEVNMRPILCEVSSAFVEQIIVACLLLVVYLLVYFGNTSATVEYSGYISDVEDRNKLIDDVNDDYVVNMSAVDTESENEPLMGMSGDNINYSTSATY